MEYLHFAPLVVLFVVLWQTGRIWAALRAHAEEEIDVMRQIARALEELKKGQRR